MKTYVFVGQIHFDQNISVNCATLIEVIYLFQEYILYDLLKNPIQCSKITISRIKGITCKYKPTSRLQSEIQIKFTMSNIEPLHTIYKSTK